MKQSQPGRRFQDYYHRRQKRRGQRPQIRKLITVISGIFIICIGVVFWFIPGSGWVIIIIGTGVIAGEAKTIARFMDWCEIKIRKLLKKFGKKKNG
ncbi:hypothetical protein JW935_25655 [candidate division KSB1 bacterium]|nr:hypothetical protein [candidate division KSB1 bacterium]